MIIKFAVQGVVASAAAAALVAGGCASPLERSQEQALRESLLASQRAHLAAVADAAPIALQRPPSEVEAELSPERRAELDRLSGMTAYAGEALLLGPDLLGRVDAPVVQLSLREAVHMAMVHNLDAKVARLTPAIAETQLTQAQAEFDAFLFTNIDYEKLDTPRPGGLVPGLSGDQQSENFSVSTGIRQRLPGGASAVVQTGIRRQEQQPSVLGVNRYYTADVLASLRQPLLRNFGSDVNQAQILLARNLQAAERQRFEATLIDVAYEVEATYWNLVFARQRLLIQLRLLDRTIDDRNRLSQRAEFDVSPVRLTEASSFVELRRAEVIRARQQVRDLSDRLKRLINAPDLAISDETVILPVEAPADVPITFSLLDAIGTALRESPIVQEAVLAIRDASIRQRIADNARLPILDLVATVGVNGLDIEDPGEAYRRVGDLNYIDYILGVEFELPIGNRGPEALYAQRRLERRQTLLQFRQAAQNAVLEVKAALRQVLTSYELIGATRAARRAAADNLRALEEQEQAGVALTPEFLLDLKLNAQQRLADSEIQEAEALTTYMAAIAQLYRVMGTLLERDQIVVVAENSAG